MESSASIGLPGQSVTSATAEAKVVLCPLCGAHENKALFTQRQHTLMHCGSCDLSFIHPYPTDAKRHHETVSNYQYDDLEVVRCGTQYENEKLFYDRYFEFIRRECAGASSILDVGCGCGHLLERLAEYTQLMRAGIELNRERARFARNKARCEVFEVPIEEFDGTRRFDVVTLINVFSHVPNIGKLFEKLRCLMSERGKVILKTGEVRSDVKRSAIFDWEFPDHLQFLGWRTLEYISGKYEFRIEKHLRVPLSLERFARSTWSMKGTSGVRNVIKRGVARLPFALTLMAGWYDALHKGSISSSLIVLRGE
jgi:2-polyprenyl-3-methyl-5-hydroxy-6-metoxy-1,4-benzoquinol methylase